MKHVIPPNGCAGGGNGRTGDIWINPEHPGGKALADALRRLSARGPATSSGSTPRAAAGMAIRSRAIPSACSPTCARALVSREAAERDYGVVLERAARSWASIARPRKRAGRN